MSVVGDRVQEERAGAGELEGLSLGSLMSLPSLKLNHLEINGSEKKEVHFNT